MYAWEAVEKTLDYMEGHLSDELKTQTLADIAGLSKFYYQRLFKRLIGKPVQEYIKLRRLAGVAEDLKDKEHRILDIALDYGFSDHANFTRAFRETYHITPEEYRKNQIMLNKFDKPELSMGYVMIDENVPLIVGDIVLEIHRKTLGEPEWYWGIEKEINIAGQIPAGESTGVDVPGQLWHEYHERMGTEKGAIRNDRELGMSYSANMEKGTFLYFVGGMFTTEADQSKEMIKKELPMGEYVVCSIEAESFEELVTTALNQAYKYLFGSWLKNHQLVTAPFSAEKYYRERTEDCCMEIWLKIQSDK